MAFVCEESDNGCVDGRGADRGGVFPGLFGAALMAGFECFDGDLLPCKFDERIVGAGDMKDRFGWEFAA
ncbi:MAG: hypothetical protein RL215_2275 [Planctomycetota bacterium]